MPSVSPPSPSHPAKFGGASENGLWLVVLAGCFILLEAALINGSLALLHQESILFDLRRFLAMRADQDSWGPMASAYDWYKSRQAGTIYQEIFFGQHVKFQYSPTSLLPFALADRLGVDFSLSRFNAIGWLSVVIEMAAVAALAMISGKRAGVLGDSPVAAAASAVVAALACFVFYPVLKAYGLGQIQTWINAAFALACLCWITERKAAAGVLVGAICLLKPQFGLFLIWGALRREWGFLAGWAAIVLPGLAASVAIFGLDDHLDYIKVLQFIAARGEAFYTNFTVNGLVNRALGNGDNLHFHADEFAPYNAIVYGTTFVTSAVLVLAALLWDVRRRATDPLDFLIAGLIFTVASPIAWVHHFGILPPIFVILFFAIAALPDAASRRFLLAALAVAFVLTANYFYNFVTAIAATPFNFLESYVFFAALILLALLYRLRRVLPALGY